MRPSARRIPEGVIELTWTGGGLSLASKFVKAVGVPVSRATLAWWNVLLAIWYSSGRESGLRRDNIWSGSDSLAGRPRHYVLWLHVTLPNAVLPLEVQLIVVHSILSQPPSNLCTLLICMLDVCDINSMYIKSWFPEPGYTRLAENWVSYNELYSKWVWGARASREGCLQCYMLETELWHNIFSLLCCKLKPIRSHHYSYNSHLQSNYKCCFCLLFYLKWFWLLLYVEMGFLSFCLVKLKHNHKTMSITAVYSTRIPHCNG